MAVQWSWYRSPRVLIVGKFWSAILWVTHVDRCQREPLSVAYVCRYSEEGYLPIFVNFYPRYFQESVRREVEYLPDDMLPEDMPTAQQNFGSILLTMQTMFWAIFAMMDATAPQLDYYGTSGVIYPNIVETFGRIIWPLYHFSMIIVIVNMLIGLLTFLLIYLLPPLGLFITQLSCRLLSTSHPNSESTNGVLIVPLSWWSSTATLLLSPFHSTGRRPVPTCIICSMTAAVTFVLIRRAPCMYVCTYHTYQSSLVRWDYTVFVSKFRNHAFN